MKNLTDHCCHNDNFFVSLKIIAMHNVQCCMVPMQVSHADLVGIREVLISCLCATPPHHLLTRDNINSGYCYANEHYDGVLLRRTSGTPAQSDACRELQMFEKSDTAPEVRQALLEMVMGRHIPQQPSEVASCSRLSLLSGPLFHDDVHNMEDERIVSLSNALQHEQASQLMLLIGTINM